MAPSDAFRSTTRGALFGRSPEASAAKMMTADKKRIRSRTCAPRFGKNRLRPASLLITQCNHRIQFHRAPCRDVAGKQRDTDENEGDTDKGQRICRPHAVEQTCHQVRNDQGTNKSNCGTHNSEAQSLTQNNVENVRSWRPECEADPDLVCSLSH